MENREFLQVEDYLSKDFYRNMKHAVKNRVSDERYQHIKSVAKTCKCIAKTYDLDVEKAKLAGILHDWDKGLTNDEVVEKACRLGLQNEFSAWEIQHLPNILHGPTAATEIVKNFNNFPNDVAHAIAVHTTACPNMSKLDMCLYVADAIEPTRNYPELKELRDLVGEVPLQELYETVFCLWTIKLIRRKKLIYPKTLDTYNKLILSR